MKRLVRLAVRIYPRQWRERYGVEFAALLDQLPGKFGDLTDICLEAIKMRLKPANVPVLVAYAVLGFILAWGSSQTIGSHAAAHLSETLFTVLGVPVVRDGNLLLLARNQLSAGYLANGLLAMTALALLAAAHLVNFEMRLGSRLLFLLGLIPVTIIASSTRIVVTGVLAEANAGRGLVTAAGWLSFIVCAGSLLMLFQRFMRSHNSRAARPRSTALLG